MNPNDLKQFRELRDLSETELEMLIPLLEQRDLAKGRRIMSEGEDAEGLVLLTHGSVTLTSEAGHMGTAEAPVAFGAAALVTVGTRAVTAVAADPCTIQLLTRTAFHRFAEDAPRAAVRVLEAIVSDLATLLRQGLDHV